MKEESNASFSIQLRNHLLIVRSLPIHLWLIWYFLGDLANVKPIDITTLNRNLDQMNRLIGFNGINAGDLHSQLARFLV